MNDRIYKLKIDASELVWDVEPHPSGDVKLLGAGSYGVVFKCRYKPNSGLQKPALNNNQIIQGVADEYISTKEKEVYHTVAFKLPVVANPNEMQNIFAKFEAEGITGSVLSNDYLTEENLNLPAAEREKPHYTLSYLVEIDQIVGKLPDSVKTKMKLPATYTGPIKAVISQFQSYRITEADDGSPIFDGGNVESFFRDTSFIKSRPIKPPHYLTEKDEGFKSAATDDFDIIIAQIAAGAYKGLEEMHRHRENGKEKSILHLDFAARNLLMSETQFKDNIPVGFSAKVSDFGYCEELDEGNDFVKFSSGIMPLRWSNKERILNHNASKYSDFHSFRIFLFEAIAALTKNYDNFYKIQGEGLDAVGIAHLVLNGDEVALKQFVENAERITRNHPQAYYFLQAFKKYLLTVNNGNIKPEEDKKLFLESLDLFFQNSLNAKLERFEKAEPKTAKEFKSFLISVNRLMQLPVSEDNRKICEKLMAHSLQDSYLQDPEKQQRIKDDIKELKAASIRIINLINKSKQLISNQNEYLQKLQIANEIAEKDVLQLYSENFKNKDYTYYASHRDEIDQLNETITRTMNEITTSGVTTSDENRNELFMLQRELQNILEKLNTDKFIWEKVKTKQEEVVKREVIERDSKEIESLHKDYEHLKAALNGKKNISKIEFARAIGLLISISEYNHSLEGKGVKLDEKYAHDFHDLHEKWLPLANEKKQLKIIWDKSLKAIDERQDKTTTKLSDETNSLINLVNTLKNITTQIGSPIETLKTINDDVKDTHSKPVPEVFVRLDNHKKTLTDVSIHINALISAIEEYKESHPQEKLNIKILLSTAELYGKKTDSFGDIKNLQKLLSLKNLKDTLLNINKASERITNAVTKLEKTKKKEDKRKERKAQADYVINSIAENTATNDTPYNKIISSGIEAEDTMLASVPLTSNSSENIPHNTVTSGDTPYIEVQSPSIPTENPSNQNQRNEPTPYKEVVDGKEQNQVNEPTPYKAMEGKEQNRNEETPYKGIEGTADEKNIIPEETRSPAATPPASSSSSTNDAQEQKNQIKKQIEDTADFIKIKRITNKLKRLNKVDSKDLSAHLNEIQNDINNMLAKYEAVKPHFENVKAKKLQQNLEKKSKKLKEINARIEQINPALNAISSTLGSNAKTQSVKDTVAKIAVRALAQHLDDKGAARFKLTTHFLSGLATKSVEEMPAYIRQEKSEVRKDKELSGQLDDLSSENYFLHIRTQEFFLEKLLVDVQAAIKSTEELSVRLSNCYARLFGPKPTVTANAPQLVEEPNPTPANQK